MKRALLAALLLLVVACSGDDAEPAAPTTATTSSTSTTARAELYPAHTGELYAGTENWICHPDRADGVCTDIRTTVVTADGTRTLDDLAPAADPAFDCFYVYPTTSTDPGANSDLDVDRSETQTVAAQVARFASVCRVFAPAYRQVTLVGIFGAANEDSRQIAYADVVDAWSTYVDELGEGRGVVLIGHSQGAGLLNRLLTEEIGPSPEQRALVVSAVLLGSAFVEGSIPGIPTCTSADEAGCVITYASYPADQPPGEGAFFGRARGSGEPAACVDPVALAGGNGLADAILPAESGLFPGAGIADITTPFVAYPAALRTECVGTADRGYLAVSRSGQADDRDLEPLFRQIPDPSWGTHVADANLAQDDIIEVVTRQAAAHAGG